MDPLFLQTSEDLHKRLKDDLTFQDFLREASIPPALLRRQSLLWAACIGAALLTAFLLGSGLTRILRGPLALVPLLLVLAMLAPFLYTFWQRLRVREEGRDRVGLLFEALKTGTFETMIHNQTVVLSQGDVVLARMSRATAFLLEADRSHTRGIEEELPSSSPDSSGFFQRPVLEDGQSASGESTRFLN